MRIKILGVPVDVVTRKEAEQRLLMFLEEEKNHLLITPNPEIVMKAQKDPELMDILQSADLVVPDGIGLVWASRWQPVRIQERVPGCDLTLALLDAVKDREIGIYLLGAAPGVAQAAKIHMERRFQNLRICGVQDGYFKKEEEEKILQDIREKKPEILLVGLGSPRQEKWIARHKDLPVRISAGVGGSIDVMAGRVKRAPVLFQRLGLEWFYRLLSQPKRILRMGSLPRFVFAVVKEKFDKK